ncbi:MAG: RNA 3'-terminal phosphate cyclase, partial [Candidatus Aenigmatarchaeota archaeon]
LIKQIKGRAPFDEYMEDQIIPFMALSSLDNKSTSIIRVGHLTKHTETNIWIVEKFLPVKFEVGDRVIECNPV